jgi:type III pantothenate kinase
MFRFYFVFRDFDVSTFLYYFYFQNHKFPPITKNSRLLNLILDIGTTYIKIAVFRHSEILFRESLPEISREYIKTITENFQGIEHSILSSVRKRDRSLIEYLDTNFKVSIELSEKTPVPIKNLYKSPATLGHDRLAAVVGAISIFPGSNILIIDIGSAVTFDFINSKSEYHGGNISPGMIMRFRALHEFTSNLPFEYPHDNQKFMGSETQEAIISGVQNGLIFELDGYIRRFSEKEKELKVILTGGDAEFFAEKISNKVITDPNITLKGLNRILEFNLK